MSNWNIEELFSPVQYQIISTDGSIQSILFKNETYLGQPTEVFAYLGVPNFPQGHSIPGMVCVHGGGGTAFKEWVEIWVSRGYAAIAMDLSGRDESGNRLSTGGPDQDHGAKFSTSSDYSLAVKKSSQPPWGKSGWSSHPLSERRSGASSSARERVVRVANIQFGQKIRHWLERVLFGFKAKSAERRSIG